MMARKTAILKLKSDVRAELNERIDRGSDSIDQLLEWVETQDPGCAISRSGLGRYVKKRRTRERAAELVAEAISDFDESSSNEAVDLMLELASLKVREARILDRLRDIGVV